eukprot:224074-Pyramimonas_sp.AAC.2
MHRFNNERPYCKGRYAIAVLPLLALLDLNIQTFEQSSEIRRYLHRRNMRGAKPTQDLNNSIPR